MAGFLYFRAGDTRPITRDLIAKYGLGYAFTGGLTNRPTSSTSPSGTPGLVFADASRQEGQDVGYHPDRQTWRKLPRVEGRPELWVAYWNEAKPGPGDLERMPMLAADVTIRLADGNPWRIPRVREYNGVTGEWECLLPSLYDYGDDGRLFPAKPLAEHARLWEITAPVASALCLAGDEVASVTEEQVQLASVELVKANYVVDMPELVAIGALATGDTFASIILAACRGKTLLDWIATLQKKSDPLTLSGSSTDAGNEG